MNSWIVAAALAFLGAGSAEAVTRQVAFSFDLGGAEIPSLGITSGDSFSGLFSFDDSGLQANVEAPLQPIITSLSLIMGSQVWEVSDLVRWRDGITVDASGAVRYFFLDLEDAGAGLVGAVSSYNMAYLDVDGGPFAYCNGCVSFSEVTAIPLPAGLPLAAGGLAVLGVAGWRRRGGTSPFFGMA